jgi:hypothetical protein
MTFLPQLEHELLAAHRRRQARPRRAARVRAAAGLGLVAAVTAAVAVFVVIGIGTPHHAPTGGGPSSPPQHATGPVLPTNPPKRQRREERYLNQALGALSIRDRTCSLTNVTDPKPTISHGSPSQSLLSRFGVLRRPAVPTDRLPARITYHPYKRDPTGSLPPFKGVYVRYIRRTRWRYGAGYYLVPAANVHDGIRPMPARCYAALHAAVVHELSRVPTRLRAGTLSLEPRLANQLRAETAPAEGVCLLVLNRSGNGGTCINGYTPAEIEQRQTVSSGGATAVAVVYGLAPDGVDAVTLQYRTGSFTVPVTNNVFILKAPRSQRLPNNGIPEAVIWRGANGSTIKTIASP